MGYTVLFTEDCPDVSIPALEYAGFGSVPYKMIDPPLTPWSLSKTPEILLLSLNLWSETTS